MLAVDGQDEIGTSTLGINKMQMGQKMTIRHDVTDVYNSDFLADDYKRTEMDFGEPEGQGQLEADACQAAVLDYHKELAVALHLLHLLIRLRVGRRMRPDKDLNVDPRHPQNPNGPVCAD